MRVIVINIVATSIVVFLVAFIAAPRFITTLEEIQR